MNFTHFRYTSQKKYVCVKNLVSVHAKPLYRERGNYRAITGQKRRKRYRESEDQSEKHEHQLRAFNSVTSKREDKHDILHAVYANIDKYVCTRILHLLLDMLLRAVVVRDVCRTTAELRNRFMITRVDVVRDELVAHGDGRARGRVLVEEVDLLEGKPTGLGDAEVRKDDAAKARRAPDEEHLRLEVRVALARVDEVRRRETDGEIPEPVRRRGKRHALRAHVEREDLADDDPRDGPPRRREEGDVDAHESDEHLLAREVRLRDGHTRDGNDELAHAHAHRTDEQQPAASEALDTPHARECHEAVDDVCRDADEEGVFDARVLEENRAVVEDEVDAGELLPSLEGHAGEDTEGDLVRLARGEAVLVGGNAELFLFLERSANVVEFFLDDRIIGRQSGEAGKRKCGTVIVSLLDIPTG